MITGSRLGLLDNIASRTAIAAEAAALAIRHEAPNLMELSGTDLKSIKSSALAEAIKRGDKAVEELVRSRAQLLGLALSNVVDLMNPEMVLLGGGLTQAMPKLILEEVKAGITGRAGSEAVEDLKIVTAKMKTHAVTIGAAKLAAQG